MRSPKLAAAPNCSKEYVELTRPKIESHDPIFFTGTRSHLRVSGNDRLFPRVYEFGANPEIPASPIIQLQPRPDVWWPCHQIRSRPNWIVGLGAKSGVSGNDLLFPRGSEFGPNSEIQASPVVQLRPRPGRFLHFRPVATQLGHFDFCQNTHFAGPLFSLYSAYSYLMIWHCYYYDALWYCTSCKWLS